MNTYTFWWTILDYQLYTLMPSLFDDNNLRKPHTQRIQVNKAEYLARHRTVDELLDERNYIKAQEGTVPADYEIIDQALRLKFA